LFDYVSLSFSSLGAFRLSSSPATTNVRGRQASTETTDSVLPLLRSPLARTPQRLSLHPLAGDLVDRRTPQADILFPYFPLLFHYFSTWSPSRACPLLRSALGQKMSVRPQPASFFSFSAPSHPLTAYIVFLPMAQQHLFFFPPMPLCGL